MNGERTYQIMMIVLLCIISIMENATAQDEPDMPPKYRVESIGDTIEVINCSSKMDGFWIYLPKEEVLPANNVVLFMHGYGAFNPLLFGGWIRHLVEAGNIVIYPRYQKTLTVPKPRDFVGQSLTGLKDALQVLKERGWDEALWEELDVVGHSYGGVISMNLAENQKKYDIPTIKNIMIVNAGTGPFKAGILDNYDRVDANLIMITSRHDTTVGSKFTKRVERLTTKKLNKIYLSQNSFKGKDFKLTSHHNEPYALDSDFDNGARNFTVKKAFKVGRTNVVDTEGYWKLFDELILGEDDFLQFIVKLNRWPLSEEYPELQLTIKHLD